MRPRPRPLPHFRCNSAVSLWETTRCRSEHCPPKADAELNCFLFGRFYFKKKTDPPPHPTRPDPTTVVNPARLMNKTLRPKRFVCRHHTYPAPLSEMTRALTAHPPVAGRLMTRFTHNATSTLRTTTSSTVVCCFGCCYTLCLCDSS